MNLPEQRQLSPYPGLTLTLTEAGAGPPVLLLHGGAGPGSLAEIAGHLRARHRVLTPTHPGWEGTPRPDWFSGVDSLAETYLDFLDDAGLRGAALVGSSFGGWVAAEMAVRDRGRCIERLVLLDAVGPEIPGHEVRAPGGGPPGDAPRAGAAGEPEQAAEPRRGPPPGNMQALFAYAGPSLRDPKLLPRLARIRANTLVLWGENDAVVTPDFGRAYAAAIPGARFEVIAGAGHVPTREQPGATLAAIDAFLTPSHAEPTER